ncbi:transcription termination factor 5, mitochondrial-like isoform X2 [Anticarsia gemmatalis]
MEFYKEVTGETITNDYFEILKKRHPNIEGISHDRLQCTLQILQKFNITAQEACQHLHVFSMNPITMDNYGEILKECGFLTILPNQIIKYHTLVKSRTVAQLKKDSLLPKDVILEQNILDKLTDWPDSLKSLQNFSDSQSNILMVRMNVLERYLYWKLSVTAEEFKKYCIYYLPLKHKPMSDIQESINLAQNELKFSNESIKRNGFVLSADPLHTKLLLENIEALAGINIRDVIKLEPAILKNNYNSVIQIRDILEEYRISVEQQRKCLKVYCMCPDTVRQRLEELRQSKEYKILSTNPRVLYLVVHKNKMMKRLAKIETANKQCYSLNHLVSSNKVFNSYISSFGDKVCGRDIAVLITSSLHNLSRETKRSELTSALLKQLRRHKYWLHAAISVIDENIQFLRKKFHDQTIFNNCHILLYPVSDVEHYINMLENIREGRQRHEKFIHDINYTIINSSTLTDDQILSLVLYEIEKKYHFSGDGIWSKDAIKVDSQSLK